MKFKNMSVVSFEKGNAAGAMKTTAKVRRIIVPGIIEKAEIRRCDDIETDLYVRNIMEKRFGVPLY